jgi:Skp family chaperone for outer membrane proteins
MKAFTVVSALSFALLTVPAIAQQKPPVQKPPATSPAQPALQKPAPPKPIAPPAAQSQPARPFPEGAKIAFFSLNDVAQGSKAGQAAAAQIKALQEKKVKEIDDKQKQIATNQTLLQSPTLAEDRRAALSKEIDRANLDLQRLQQDAQQEMTDLQNELQRSFAVRVNPIVQQLATEKGLQLLFSREESGLYWSDSGLDLSAEITRRLDAAAPKPPAPDVPAPQPPAPKK